MSPYFYFHQTFFVADGPVEIDPEYQLIIDSNNVTVEIDNEISKIQLFYVHYVMTTHCLFCFSYRCHS